MKVLLKNLIKHKKAINIALGLAGAISLSASIPASHLSGRDTVIYSNTFHSLLFCITITGIYCFIREKLGEASKISKEAMITSFLFSAFLVVGEQLETKDNFNFLSVFSYGKIIFLSILFSAIIEYLWLMAGHYENKWLKNTEIQKENKDIHKDSMLKHGKNKKGMLRNFILIFICWLPVFLSFYPGAFVYDAYDEYMQVKTGEYTTHHPLSHVLLLGKAVVWGEEILKNANIGIAVYTILQMMLLAAVFAYVIEILKNFGIGPLAEAGAVAFYSFFPLFPMYAVCSSKDTLFTGFFLLLFVKAEELTDWDTGFYKKRRNVVIFMAAAVLMMLFRNNGSYAYLVWVMVAVISIFCADLWAERKKRSKIVIMLVLPLFMYAGISSLLANGLQAVPGGKQEILTVPIQQLARTYHYAPEVFSEEDKESLYEILPEEALTLYTPRISDLVKSNFNNNNFQENPGKYLKLWLKTGLKKPFLYINAWLLTSYGYWYPDAVINVYGGTARHTIVYDHSSYFGFETEPPGVRESKIPLLEKHFRKISLDLYQQKLPGISMFFSPGFLFWVFLFYFGLRIRNREWGRSLSMSLILLLWMTALLGPTYLVRYVLILWFALPVIILGHRNNQK